jgi:UPF0755 protein
MSRPPADEWGGPRDRYPDDGRYGRGDVHAGVHHDDVHPDDVHADDLHHDEFAADYPDEQYDYHDQTLADDVLAQGGREDEPVMYRPRRRAKRSPLLRIGAIAIALVAVVVGGILGFNAVRGMIPDLDLGQSAPEDYEGSGTGEVLVDIPQGAGGGQIGQILYEAGVVASAEGFANVAAADPRSTGIQPGTYELAEQMSSSAALDRLVDPSARQTTGVTIREGLWTDEVFTVLAEETGNELADYEAVDPEALDLPEAANGELEGYLFPDTYEFSPTSSPEEQLNIMVERGNQVREELGVSADETERVMIIASIVQGEAAFPDDLPKVARVVENRLADGEPLGMDSTIHFMFQERGRAGTTEEQRKTEDPYNTYLNAGLPPGPINNPGAAAIEAALDPAEGEWKYFVTVNPDSGETVFAETYEEHLENQEQFQEWCRENQDRC